MSDTLWGVIVGGTIASLTPLVNLYISEKRWKKEAKLQYLKAKRDKLEVVFKDTFNKLLEAVDKNFYSTDMLSDFDFIFPKEVSEAFEKMLSDKSKHNEVDGLKNKKFHIYTISRSMKKALADLDHEIYSEICR